MPFFRRADHIEWIDDDTRTAQFIRYFWKASSKKERSNSSFLYFLIQCGWINLNNKGKYADSTREWRNESLARYLGIAENDPMFLESAVLARWPKMNIRVLRKFLNSHTGITHYYPPYRNEAQRFVKKHEKDIAAIFNIIASDKSKSSEKTRNAMNIIDGLPLMQVPHGRKTSILNAISPSLACLDPHKRFPIMNNRTKKLLVSLGKDNNAAGAEKLYSLIGRYGICNNLELDIYSQEYKFPPFKSVKTALKRPTNMREVGFKQEEVGYGEYSKEKYRIHKIHNRLINRFKNTMPWHCTLKESNFDILIENWQEGKMLLVEAKTSSAGVGGRMQIRQAIGQLFDYRKTYFGNFPDKVELAILLPSEPSQDVKDLLISLDIHVLWLKRNKLEGTIALNQERNLNGKQR